MRLFNMWLLFIQVCIIFRFCGAQNLVTDVTGQVFTTPSSRSGFVAAYVDINNDKLTDICVVSENRKELKLVYGGTEASVVQFKSLVITDDNLSILGVIPGDYNGDGYVDILITLKDGNSNSNLVQIKIFWGDSENKFTSQNNIVDQVIDEPLLLDANADMVSDLFVTIANGTRQFWLGHAGAITGNWSFGHTSFSKASSRPVKFPHSNAFVDLTGDGGADLFVTTLDTNGRIVFEVWQGTEHGPQLFSNYSLPNEYDNFEIGQSAFADINGDGQQEHILPVCKVENKRCIRSIILVYFDKKWIEIFSDNNPFNFISSQANYINQPITLVLGDFNQDVYVDLVCVMYNINHTVAAEAHILYGGPCGGEKCQNVRFQFSYKLTLPNTEGAFSASFYSIQNNGALDILVSVASSNVSVRAYQNTGVNDASFVFIKVLPGTPMLGSSNVPGANVRYTSTNVMGGVQISSACQLTQSSHLSLQLPYVLFGLGRLPNFIDTLTVSMPAPLLATTPGNPTSYIAPHSTWTMLIPNSKLYIIPYPLNDSSSWKNVLVVTPSRNIISTAFVLLSTCIVVAITIIVLHCMERREDKREKIREAHRFHFDAM
ncbi:T-cell immunomodulatory protein-like [Ciona intestinalis]